MIAEGDGSAACTNTVQSGLTSDSVSAGPSKLTSEQQSDSMPRSVDIDKDVADVVDDIILSVASADDVIHPCAPCTMTSVASSTFDCQSTHVCSTIVSASGDTADDVQLVEMQPNGNYCIMYYTID